MKTVKEIMVTTPQYCEKNESLQSVAEQMSSSGIGSMPIVDKNKKPIGVITDRDICLAAANESDKALSELKVQDVKGKQRVHTCTIEDNLQTALKIMRTQKVGRLPVVDQDQKLQGVISLNHIVRKIHDTSDEAEIGYKGEENVFKTLYSLASRKPEMSFVE